MEFNMKKQEFYIKVPFTLACDRNITSLSKLVYSYLTFRQGQHRYAWPKMETMAKDLGVSRTSINRSIKELKSKGFISVLSTQGWDGQPNKYSINCDITKMTSSIESEKVTDDIRGRINRGVFLSLKWIFNKKISAFEYLDFSITDLMQHLESKFTEDVTWDNLKEWHIDHIVPKSVFEFSSPDDREFKLCWSLRNLQPLLVENNVAKSAHIGTKWGNQKLYDEFFPSMVFNG